MYELDLEIDFHELTDEDIQTFFVEYFQLMKMEDTTIYTDEKPSRHKPLEESPVVLNLTKVQRQLQTKLDSGCRKYVSDIVYTKLKHLLVEGSVFEKTLRNILTDPPSKILYPM